MQNGCHIFFLLLMPIWKQKFLTTRPLHLQILHKFWQSYAKRVSYFLPFVDAYLQTKVLNNTSITSKDIAVQRIEQFTWLRIFSIITWEHKICQTWNLRKKLEQQMSFHFDLLQSKPESTASPQRKNRFGLDLGLLSPNLGHNFFRGFSSTWC